MIPRGCFEGLPSPRCRVGPRRRPQGRDSRGSDGYNIVTLVLNDIRRSAMATNAEQPNAADARYTFDEEKLADNEASGSSIRGKPIQVVHIMHRVH